MLEAATTVQLLRKPGAALLLAALALVGACQGPGADGTQARRSQLPAQTQPAQTQPAQTQLPVQHAARLPAGLAAHRRSAIGSISTPFDLSAVIRQVQLAFHSTKRGFSGGHTTYLVHAHPDGGLKLQAYHHVEGQDLRSEPLGFRTAALGRGAAAVLGRPRAATVQPDGALSFDRGAVKERLKSSEQGVEQSWSFAEKPAGRGDLQIRVDVTAKYVGQTAHGLHFADRKTGLGFRYGHATWIDAEARETPIRARRTPRGVTLSVPHSLLEASRYPATLDPVIGPEFGMDTAVYVPPVSEETAPALASAAGRYLVAWQRKVGTDFDIFATRVDGTGTVLDPTGIAVYRGSGNQLAPAVSTDGTNFLVAWQDGRASPVRVYAARVRGSDGVVLDTGGFAVAKTSSVQNNPTIAFAGTNYLVAWQDKRVGTNWDIFAGRVRASDGAVLGVADIPVSQASNDQTDPAVTYGASSYYVVWQDRRSTADWDIYGARVDSVGTVQDTGGQAISTWSNDQATPAIAFDGTNHLVVWSDCRVGGCTTNPPTGWDIYATTVNATTGVATDLNGKAISTAVYNQQAPAVGYDAKTSRYLVVWQDSQSYAPLPHPVYTTTWDIYGANVDTGGNIVGTAYTVSTGPDAQQAPGVAYDSTNTQLLAVWQDLSSGTTGTNIDIYGTLVNGGVPGTNFPVSIAPNEQQTADVAYSSADDSYLVVWADRRTGGKWRIYGVRVFPDETISPPGGLAISTLVSQDQVYPAVAYGNGKYLVVWQDYRTGSQKAPLISTGWDIYGRLVQSATGALVGSSDIAVVTLGDVEPVGQKDQAYPDVGFDGTNFMVVWQDNRNAPVTGVWDIYRGRVSQAGGVLDPTGGLVTGAANDQTYPALAFDGTNYLAVWQDRRGGGGFDIYGARIQPSTGMVLGSDIAISPQGNEQQAPSVGYGNGYYLVAWQDKRGGVNFDIYGAFVNPANGTVLPSITGLAISTAANDQLNPDLAFEGGVFLVTWQDMRTTSTAPDLYGARVRPWPTGTLQDSLGIAISTGTSQEKWPAIASNGNKQFLLAYNATDMSTVYQTERARVRLVKRMPLGGACLEATDCDSGICEDLVCCNAACGNSDPGDCQACSTAAGGLSNGTCTYSATTAICRDSVGACDDPEHCTGSSSGCPADAKYDSSHVCRAVAGVCDLAETCTGSSNTCPADAKQVTGTVCRSSAGVCDPAETCSGSANTCPVDAKAPAGTVCRAVAGACDLAETCSGSSNGCPADSYKAASIICRTVAGPCDVAENCTGSAASCPADGFLPVSTICRVAVGSCDLAETCTGSSVTCPVDGYQPTSTVCRAVAGPCDVAESCSGSSPSCPGNAFLAPGTVCRAVAGPCDATETCNGSSASCLTDAFLTAGTLCRAAAGVCDTAETCSGSSAGCPTDVVKGPTVTCRAAAGVCDAGETCTGFSVACPSDLYQGASKVCRVAAGPCDLAETCTGTSVTCPSDALAPTSTVCRAAAGPCDLPESCSGFAVSCPTNSFAAASTVCRMAAGVCDVVETCSGSSASCPVDGFSGSTTICRTAASECDLAEPCTGLAAACPQNLFVPNGLPCSTGVCVAGVCGAMPDGGADGSQDGGLDATGDSQQVDAPGADGPTADGASVDALALDGAKGDGYANDLITEGIKSEGLAGDGSGDAVTGDTINADGAAKDGLTDSAALDGLKGDGIAKDGLTDSAALDGPKGEGVGDGSYGDGRPSEASTSGDGAATASDGCSCEVGGAPGATPLGLLLIGLALALGRRRRRHQ